MSEQLIRQWHPHCARLADAFARNCPDLDRNDLESAALMAVVESERTFRGGIFAAHAKRLIKQRVIDAARRVTGKRCGLGIRRVRKSVCALSIDEYPHLAATEGRLSNITPVDELDDICARLPTRYAQILRLRVNGFSMREIGEKIGLSESRVSQVFSKIVNDLRFGN